MWIVTTWYARGVAASATERPRDGEAGEQGGEQRDEPGGGAHDAARDAAHDPLHQRRVRFAGFFVAGFVVGFFVAGFLVAGASKRWTSSTSVRTPKPVPPRTR